MKPATQEQVDAAFELLSPKDFAKFCADQDQLKLTQAIKAELLSPVWGQGPAADLFNVQASTYPVWKQEYLGTWATDPMKTCPHCGKYPPYAGASPYCSTDCYAAATKQSKKPKTYFSGRFA